MAGNKRAAAISACASAALGFGGWATSAESVHPNVAPVLYGLALVAGVGVLVLMLAPSSSAFVEDWRQQEQRFRQINKGIYGHWNREAGSRELRWSIWPKEGATPRDRELFEAEATHASRLLKRTLGHSDRKYVAWFGSNEVDQWLTAIRSIVHPGTDVQSSGVDAGRKVGGHLLDELPVMSAIACVKLASGARPRLGVPSNLE